MSDYTVKGIKRQVRDEIPDWKKNTSRKLEEIISELIDSIQCDLLNNKLSPDRKAIAVGILMDKRERLAQSDRSVVNNKVTAECSVNFSEKLHEWMASLTIQNTGE